MKKTVRSKCNISNVTILVKKSFLEQILWGICKDEFMKIIGFPDYSFQLREI